MAVKFPLKMSDGIPVRTMEELREHFDFPAVLKYYSSGSLGRWLSDRYYDEEAEKVGALDPSLEDFKKSLCGILGVAYSEDKAAGLDLGNIAKKNERRERLKQYTADDRILAAADSVAFTQKELKQLLKKTGSLGTDEDGNKVIYLCGKHFIIPGNIGGIIYKGVNNPTVEFDGEDIEAGIDLQGVELDTQNYTDDENNGVGQNIDEYQKASEQGDAEAQCALRAYYEASDGVEENGEEAAKWHQKSGEYGSAEVQHHLADYELELDRKNEQRRERLKKYTADDGILAEVDSVAFTQEELTELLEKLDSLKTDEDDNKVIYLCGEHFTIPGNIGGIIYKCVNRPCVECDYEDIDADSVHIVLMWS